MSCNRLVSDTVQRIRRQVLLVREIKTKTAVDNAESDDDATKPDVSVRPEGAALVLLEEAMMHITEDRLEEDQDEKHNTDNRMSLIELLKLEHDQYYTCSFYVDIPCGSVWQDRYRCQMPR